MAIGKHPAVEQPTPFAYRDFTVYEFALFLIECALEMTSVAVGWQVYEITGRPLDLGLVGLAQFLPGIFLFLVSGHAADRVDRRRLLMACYGGFSVCAALLLAIAWRGSHAGRASIYPIYAVLVLLGTVRSFAGPAMRVMLPLLVPEEVFPNAVAWNASVFQAGTILGPMAGGLIYTLAHGPSEVYLTATLMALAALLSVLWMKLRTKAPAHEAASLNTVLAGFHYVWRKKLLLGLISLDMFAVLLGGAVALLPVYAREILKTGPWGLGLLRSAPGVGAVVMAIVLAQRPLRRHAGPTMLLCVAGFGGCTILFGLSRSLVLSLIALALVGATDMVSVVIRGTLIQLGTPNEMRGRVNAVDMLFIGVSNELGQFESGLTAQWFGSVPAVVLGGIGTLVIIAIWAWQFPELRNADRLNGEAVESSSDSSGATFLG
jgi:MFS family permease